MFHVRIKGNLTQFDLHDCILHHFFKFVGCNNWEWMLNLSYVHSSWKRIVGHHLSKVGLVPMDGGANCKLNVTEFHAYITRPVFQNVESIYIPCGKSDRLYVNDINQICPRVTCIYHSKWLPMISIEEFVIERFGHHSVYRVYKYDHPYAEGFNVWIKYLWDNRYKLIM